MKPKRFSIDQIIKIIAEANLPGSSVGNKNTKADLPKKQSVLKYLKKKI